MKEQEKRLKSIFYIVLAVAAVVAYAAIYSGTNIDKKYYFIILGTVPLLFIALKVYQKMSLVKKLIQLREEWGNRKIRKRDFAEIGELFRKAGTSENSAFHIDNQTWEDLNMDRIFELLDRTISTPGEQILYELLRTPLMDESSINKRKELISFFQKNKEARESVQVELSRLGRQKASLIIAFLWDKIAVIFKYKFIFNLLSLLSLAALASFTVLGPIAIVYCIFPVFALNSYIHYKVKNSISGQLPTVQYIHKLIKAANSIGYSGIRELDEYTSVLKKAGEACRGIFNKSAISFEHGFSDLEIIYEYINIFFLIEERNFFGAIDEIISHRSDLREIFLKLGELDAAISIASYRDGLKVYCEPMLHRNGAKIEAENLAHPLLEDPVANSISIVDEGIVVTGSNMSGKSTFLRTVGINALFAQTICTCIADSYKGSYLKILTSISQGDNLVGGKSYYLAEAESLLRIINASGDKIPCLCIIDEIFRGTNPIERTSASAEILSYLINNNTIVIVATHDLEITEMVRGTYNYYYFSEDINQDGLIFDYKLKKGVSKNRNAVKLMKYLGYPGEIVEKTTERVSKILG